MRRLLLLIPFLLGATYYVDPAGDDGNTGGSGDPFLTIQTGVDAATSAGDTVCVNDGTYTAGFTALTNSGSSGSPITIQNCEGGTVLIDQSESILSWTDLSGNVYESNTLTNTSPNTFWKDTTWLGAKDDCVDVDAEGEWCDNGSTIKIYTASDPNGFTYRIGQGVGASIRKIDYITLDGISVQYTGFGYELGTVFTTPSGGTSNIIVKNATISYTGSRGIRVIGTAEIPTSDITIDTMIIHDSVDTSSDNGHCIKFDSNVNGDISTGGTVTNSTIYDCWYHGIQFSNGWDDGTFSGNTIYNTSQKGSGSGASIRCGQDVVGCDIYQNTLGGGNNEIGSGIYLQVNAQDGQIYRNLIYGYDWHGLYSFQSTPSTFQIRSNIFRDNGTTGMRFATGGSNIRILSNTFEGNGNSSIAGEGAAIEIENSSSAITIQNNICYTTGSAYCLVKESGAATPIENNNLLYSTGTQLTQFDNTNHTTLSAWQSASGQGVDDVSSDPSFTALGSNDLTLTSSSPAINAGTNLNSEHNDDFIDAFRGNIYTMGAYEYPAEILASGVTVSGVNLAN